MQSTNIPTNGGNTPNLPYTMLIALGANLTSSVGAPAETLSASLVSLKNRGAAIRAVSSFYNTPAFPAGNGPDYVNAAAVIEAPWTPTATLDMLHKVEAEFGRERIQRWGQRCLDLDLIAVDDLVLPDMETHKSWRELPMDQQLNTAPGELILPHPRLQDRGFVLVPLAEIAPDWRHPVLEKSLQQMLDALPEAAKKDVVRR